MKVVYIPPPSPTVPFGPTYEAFASLPPRSPTPRRPLPVPPALPAAVSGVGGARAEARRRSSSSPTPFSGPARPAWLARRAQHVLRGQLAAPGPLRAGGHDEAAEVDRASTASRAPSELQRSGWRLWVGCALEVTPEVSGGRYRDFGPHEQPWKNPAAGFQAVGPRGSSEPHGRLEKSGVHSDQT